MNEYDISAAFEAIEQELIASMIRNMNRHRAEELKEGYDWSMWQVEQLKALEKYKLENQKKYSKQFKSINAQIGELIWQARQQGGMKQEAQILRAIKNGFKSYKPASAAMQAEFFKLNTRKLEALIKATGNDMKKAETAVLRMANDQYRKAIFNAQVYANSGAGTYEKAVDMATKDMLSRGLNCVEYKNGARHALSDYADMAIRTASKRAYLQGEGEKRQEWGISTVIVGKRGNPCPKCLPFVGKVLIDDVWSGGKASDGPYPFMSAAIARGLYHPRCKDSHSTYFPGISTTEDTWTREELKSIEKSYKKEQDQLYTQRQADKYGRLAEYSLDEENQQNYKRKAKQWNHIRFKTGDIDSNAYMESKKPLAQFRAVSKERVVNVLRKESEVWIDNLTKEEKAAIRKYTYNSGDKSPNRFFERLNAMLRGADQPNDNLIKYADTISGAIKKNKIKQDLICFRNLDINPYTDYSIGDIFREPQFTSTSVVSGKALDKKFKITLYVPKGSPGAYIEKISRFPQQRELLLDKNCLFRVISKGNDSIELEVIP
ncbi:ADP-ribosyltransferase exoenzyme [Lacrimispora xylanisolvens]|uniref:ADP-ribosyltransferase exoenzyme n=1 Tax=Lacrimispora xylanisolvens TaxID=384636 RepID=A0A2S6HQG6_9FIRM|nr:phage minor capsid protein [Hungatella xylanolytica]PPK79859.1 ADP-ribosyltransferase exoenzyme [Hungatella xylanolytica]